VLPVQCPRCGSFEISVDAHVCKTCGLNLTGIEPTAGAFSPADSELPPAPGNSPEPSPDFDAVTSQPAGDSATESSPVADSGAGQAPPPADGDTIAMRDDDAPDPADRDLSLPGLPVGHVLQERYRLDRALGRGGYGAAYLAEDLKLKRVCVVKQMLGRPGASARQLAEQQRIFDHEASLLVKLNHPGHSSIPEIYDHFSDDTGSYLVMKYIEGRSLKQAIQDNHGRLHWREAVQIMVSVCSALNYMHTHGQEPIMHRDVKPANILLGSDGRVWLVDFGLARTEIHQGSSSVGRRTSGSLGYTPLEQWFGEPVPASDIYAAGATLHYMVTGLNPLNDYSGRFDIQKIHQMHARFTPIRAVDSSLPQQLQEIIAGATAYEPANRPTALQLWQQLQVLVSGAKNVPLFTFKSGASAATVEELVDLCEQNRVEAQSHLYNGAFERWFLLINRNDLASAAGRAVEQGKNQRDGLERFLKLIMPNLLARRARYFGLQFARMALFAFVVFFVAMLFVAFAGSVVLGQFVRQSIASGVVWTFTTEDLHKEHIYTEQFLHEKFNQVAGTYFDRDIGVQISAPDQLKVSAVWNGYPVNVMFSVRLGDRKPRFYITGVNGIPLNPFTDNISRGINAGVDQAFMRGPVDVSRMIVRDGYVMFTLEKGQNRGEIQIPLPSPAPTTTPLPPTSTPTVTPTPVNVTLVVLFNELDEAIEMEIFGQSSDGEVWQTRLEIAPHEAEVIEPPGGKYVYSVRYKDGFLAANGSATWTLHQAYRVRITPDLLQTPTPEPNLSSSN